jgi:apolipoprotein N-acyltransferase
MLLHPALWALSEWVRSWLLSGFPWLSIGYSQVPSSPLAGYAPLLGVYGVSLVTAVISGAAAGAIDGFLPGRTRPKPDKPFYAFIAGVCVAVLLVTAGAVLKTHQWTQPVPGEPTSVTLLQGNIPQELKWRPERALATLETYLELVRSADGKLILLPETALPMLNMDVPPDYLKALADRTAQTGGDMLYGVPELDPSGNYYNSVMSVGTAPAQVYRKHHLVPFGDYFPLRPVLGWIMNLLHIPMSDFSPGAQVQKPMRVAGQKIAVNICYEDVFGEEIIRQLPEATMLANFTNDAWWGDSVASRQHLQIAQMRALETGRPMLRATNTGVTAIIAPDGRIVASAPEFTTTQVSGEVRGYQGSTPYIVVGNFGLLALALAMLLIPLAVARVARLR